MKEALEDGSILAKRRRHQFTNLIVQPVQSITVPASPMIIVIDGLDEYDAERGSFSLKDLIHLLVDHLRALPFRILFTSRPEARIETIFSQISSDTYHIPLQDYLDNGEVFEYLRSELSKVRANRKLPRDWPSEKDLRCLAEKSEGIWIYASTLVKFVDDEYGNPRRKLEMVLKAHNGLDALFEQVLGDAQKYPHFDLVVGAVVFVRENPSIRVFQRLLQLKSVDDVRVALRGCLSILRVPDSDDDYIRPYHTSLLDYLKDPNRRRARFFDPVKCNGTIVNSCIQLITADSGSDVRFLSHVCLNWCYHIYLMLSYAKNVNDIKSNLGSGIEAFLKNWPQWLKHWALGCEDHEGLKRARDYLYLACGMVG